jgi:AcrR family transcriptional regulator
MSFVTGKRGPMRPDSRNVVRGHETRRRILDAARTRILADGFDALRLDVLARDAGVTKAAVVKSVGGKATILLALGDEDRQTRLDAVRQSMKLRTGIERRLAHVTSLWFALDLARLNVVMPYVGYMWFWSGADHDRAQAMLDETRALIGELLADALPRRPAPARLRLLTLRVMGAYVIGLRDIFYDGATIDDTVRFVIDYTLD